MLSRLLVLSAMLVAAPAAHAQHVMQTTGGAKIPAAYHGAWELRSGDCANQRAMTISATAIVDHTTLPGSRPVLSVWPDRLVFRAIYFDDMAGEDFTMTSTYTLDRDGRSLTRAVNWGGPQPRRETFRRCR